MQWEAIFQEHILDRGFNYYEQGLVKDLKVTTALLKAKVEGSKMYTVEINYESFDKKITKLHCDCPHYESGNFCKHLAAFLFYLENKFKDFNDLKINVFDIYGSPDKKEANEKTASALVAEADDTLVRNFLIDALKENNFLKEQFKGLLRYEVTEQELIEYLRDIDYIFKLHGGGSDGFVDYYNAIELDDDLSGFMHEKINKTLLKNGFYEEAFALTNHIFLKLAKQSMDDSAGVTVNIVYSCQDYWSTIISESPLKFKREVYNWFKYQLSNPPVDYLEEYIEEMLFNYFMEEEFLIDKKEFAYRKFEEYKSQNKHWFQRIKAPNWAERYLEIVDALDGDVDEFCQNNLQYAVVREFYADKYIERNQLDEAIRLLEEGKAADDDFQYSEISREYKIKLKDLYKEVGREGDYQKELWNLIIDKQSIDMDLYKEYQGLYSKEAWEKEKVTILNELSSANNIAELYEAEELYDLLLESVVNTYGLYQLQQYEKQLVKLYPKEVFDRYEKEILYLSEATGSRKKYRKIVSMLRRMRRLPHEKSKDRVSEIFSKLREMYGNRPAMMDELNQL